jgi:hypothetical protein
MLPVVSQARFEIPSAAACLHTVMNVPAICTIATSLMLMRAGIQFDISFSSWRTEPHGSMQMVPIHIKKLK